MNRRNGSRDFGSNADDNYFRYGGYNEYVKTESNQRRVKCYCRNTICYGGNV